MIPACTTVHRVPTIDDLAPETWTAISGTQFSVRQGPDYAKNKLKGLSEESIISVYGVDVFKTKKKATNILEKVIMPSLPPLKTSPEDGFYCPRMIVLNIMLPNYAPSNPLWGTAKEDGESFSFVVYYEITQEAYDGMKKELSPAHKLLKKWLQAHPTSKEHYEMRGRLKAIPILLNPNDISLGLLRPVVNTYNSKPFLTGPKYHTFIKTDKYIEVDVDIHRYVYPARSTFFGLVSEIEKMQLDFGLVIEGKSDDELPEQMLAGIRLAHLKMTTAKDLE